MSGGRLSGGLKSGGRLSGGLMSYDPPPGDNQSHAISANSGTPNIHAITSTVDLGLASLNTQLIISNACLVICADVVILK